jgi:hypothetical protein
VCRLWRKYVFGAADEIELKFVNRYLTLLQKPILLYRYSLELLYIRIYNSYAGEIMKI